MSGTTVGFYPLLEIIRTVDSTRVIANPEFMDAVSPEGYTTEIHRLLMTISLELEAGQCLVYHNPPAHDFYIEILVNDNGVMKIDTNGVDFMNYQELSNFFRTL